MLKPKTNRLHSWLGLLALMASSVSPCLSQPEESATPLVIAHRGSSATAPENTLPAFQLAWQQGADGIEADFLLSKDGHIVCFHDKDTKRITGKKLLVKDTPLAELRQLDVGAWKDSRYAGTRIPTIAEVLATVPEDKKCFIEIKCGVEIVEPLLIEIEASTIKRDQITIICFKADVLKAIKARAPHLRTSWLCNFKQNKAGEIRPVSETVLKTLHDIKADGFSSSQHHVSEELLRQVMAAGIEHHVWTVNDPAAAGKYHAQGTKSITTDVPAKMRDALAEALPTGIDQ